ncbi:MAG: hypothetical protein ACR65R_11950 [Methylomicrobium sp.]
MKLGKNNNHLTDYSGTIASQIEEAEHRIMLRQYRAHIHADRLLKDLQKEMTSATTLVLASEVGFILGELTKRPVKSERKTASQGGNHTSHADEVSPLKEALDLGSLLAAIYQAVPLAWIVDTFYPQETTAPTKAGSAAGVKAPAPKVDLYKK